MERVRTYEEMRKKHEQDLNAYYHERAAAWNKLSYARPTEAQSKAFTKKWDDKYRELTYKHSREMEIKIDQEKAIRDERRKINNVMNIVRENQAIDEAAERRMNEVLKKQGRKEGIVDLGDTKKWEKERAKRDFLNQWEEAERSKRKGRSR